MAKWLRQPAFRTTLEPVNEARAIELGSPGLRCRAVFHLMTTAGTITPVRFAVDSGASMTFIGLEDAINRDLPVPPPEVETTLRLGTASGSEPIRVRLGRIRLWWNADRTGYPFDWPVLFRPGVPLTVPPLLGRGGVVATCVWTFDGRYDPDTPFGHLLLDDTR